MSTRKVIALRSVKASALHLVHVEGSFDQLPDSVRQMGPWTRLGEFELDQLRPAHRVTLASQQFVVIETHISDFAKRLMS